MKQLMLMRHGQTLFNEKSMVQGWCDSPLTEKGKQQAIAARAYASAFANTADHLYSSTSERACDTLELVTDRPYRRHKGLKECCYGIFEGENMNIRPQPDHWQIHEACHPYEARNDGYRRFDQTLHTLMQQPDHQQVFVVSHGDVIYHFALQQARDPELKAEVFIQNAGCMVFDYDPDQDTFFWRDYYNPMPEGRV